jgi:hypothetical protein
MAASAFLRVSPAASHKRKGKTENESGIDKADSYGRRGRVRVDCDRSYNQRFGEEKQEIGGETPLFSCRPFPK